MRATYTGPTVMAAFTRPKRPFLLHGQRVLVQRIEGDTAAVRYDHTDPVHAGCSVSVLYTITGVPLSDLSIEEES